MPTKSDKNYKLKLSGEKQRQMEGRNLAWMKYIGKKCILNIASWTDASSAYTVIIYDLHRKETVVWRSLKSHWFYLLVGK